jgi:hypothetical protein
MMEWSQWWQGLVAPVAAALVVLGVQALVGYVRGRSLKERHAALIDEHNELKRGYQLLIETVQGVSLRLGSANEQLKRESEFLTSNVNRLTNDLLHKAAELHPETNWEEVGLSCGWPLIVLRVDPVA